MSMQSRIISFIFFTLFTSLSFAQSRDSLSFFSEAFQSERQVTIISPADFKYQAPGLKLPVIYILDGQHEWFIEPLVSTLKYLKATYEIPNALVVIIPHKNRYKECPFENIDGPSNDLHRFITQDLEKQLAPFHPGSYRLIIGHSFSASFALYSFLKGDGFYSAVIANSPLDQMDNLIKSLAEKENIDRTSIAISIGSNDFDKDSYHRAAYDKVKATYPQFFSDILSFESEEAAHNSIPLIANPYFLSKLFYPFSRRFGTIAKVNEEYKLATAPDSPTLELEKINTASRLGKYYYAPEIGEINGLASRYLNSGFNEQAKSVYELGLESYPRYYDFHLRLYELYLEENPTKAIAYLKKAYTLFEDLEKGEGDYQEFLAELKTELDKSVE